MNNKIIHAYATGSGAAAPVYCYDHDYKTGLTIYRDVYKKTCKKCGYSFKYVKDYR